MLTEDRGAGGGDGRPSATGGVFHGGKRGGMGVSIGGEIRGLVGALEQGNPDLAASARVKAAWNRCAGPGVREHVTGVFVVPDTGASELVVYTDTPLWASELTMQSELMRLKLNMELCRMEGRQDGDAEPVKKLRFAASKQKYLARDRRESTYEQLEAEDAELKSVDPVPLSADEDAALKQAASGISDERLREAAYGAAKASLEWHRGLDAAGE